VPVVSATEAPPPPPGFKEDRKVALLFEAASQLPSLGLAGASCGVFLGTGLSSVTPAELEADLYPHLLDGRFVRSSLARDLAPRGGAPGRHLPARAAAALAHSLGAGGPVLTSFSACAASAQAIGTAVQALRRGEIERAVVGGQDAMAHPLGALSFLLLDTLCTEACRPFDLRRDGFMLGEGAALLLLETPAAAEASGRVPLARIVGVGASVDAYAVTAPHPDGHGAWLTMRRALEDAGLPPEAVDQVNAHGTGTPVGDRAESLAIARLLPENTPVCSIKGAVGHTIAAAGAVELVATIGAMGAGFTPGTVHCEQPDPACPVNVQQVPTDGAPGLVLSNSFGFGGQNASILVAHPDWRR
jgi:3-oxoacyl-[acyl-carrier-protein] synthase II